MTLQQLIYVVEAADNESINKAAEKLFVSQPSISEAIKDLEEELGMQIFNRTNRGITVTAQGDEFLGYARQMIEFHNMICERYTDEKTGKKHFSVSSQHYSFAVEAFIHTVQEFGMDEYEFAMHETKTGEVIENVKTLKSELGILYMNDFNRDALNKIFKRDQIEFTPLFDCNICVFLANENPLSKKKKIKIEELYDYPCISFEQGKDNSFYFAEEVLSTNDYKRVIKVDDRSTGLNLMKGLNAFTLCSGILCEELNGDGYSAVPLDTNDTMTVGYIRLAKVPLSDIAGQYIEKLKKYENKVIKVKK